MTFPPSNIHLLFEPNSNPNLLYQLKPGSGIIFEGMGVKIPPSRIEVSRLGIRDREYPGPKGNSFRMIVLGDSFTLGWGVNLGDTFVKRLEGILNEAENRRFEVMNFGVPGFNTRQEVEFLKEKGLALDPDVVLVGFMGNDFDRVFNFNALPRLLRPLYDHLYLMRAAYTGYLVAWELYQANYYHRRGGLDGVTEALAELKELGEQKGFRVALLLFTDGRWVSRQLVLFCRQIGIPVLDLTHLRKKELVIPDDYHPTAEAHRLYAGEIYRFLQAEDLIGAWPGGRLPEKRGEKHSPR